MGYDHSLTGSARAEKRTMMWVFTSHTESPQTANSASPFSDHPGDAESHPTFQGYGLLQECILGHERRSLEVLWRVFQRLGVWHELATCEIFPLRNTFCTNRLLPKVSWIGSAQMPLAHITKIEDARTGQWLRALDPKVDPITRYDLGWMMGDWNQLDIGVETVGLRKWTVQTIEIHTHRIFGSPLQIG
jgi:hypothetical protein